MKLAEMKPEHRIAILYALFGCLWIFFSDKLAASVSGTITLSAIQTYKGWMFVVLSAALIFLLVRQHSSKTRLMHERLRQREQRFHSTLENLLEGCQIISRDWFYLYLNDAAAKHGKTTVGNLLGKTMMEAYPGIEQTELFSIMKRCMDERLMHRMENEFIYPDGSKGWFVLSIEPVPEGLFILSQDITDRKRDELRIQHLTRLYATLSQVNQTIVRVKDRDELFESICRVSVEYGKFGLAWVGIIDAERGQVTPVSIYGDSTDGLPFSEINFREAPFRDGLVGKAIANGEIAYSNDIHKEQTLRHWSEADMMSIYHSAAAIPFRFEGEVTGLLMLFAADTDFFDDREQHLLLEEIAMDTSFALNGMAREKKRQEAEDAFRDSEERLHFALQSCNIGAWDLDLTDHTAYRSLEHDRIFGYEALLPSWTLDDFFKHALSEYHEPIRTMVAEATASRTGWTYECPIRRVDGEIRWIWFTGRHYTNEFGHDRVAGVVLDVTDRKKAEEQLRESNERFNRLVSELNDIVWTAELGCKQIIDVNNSFESVYGFPMEIFREKPDLWLEVVHPEDREIAEESHKMLIEQGKSTAEYRIVRPDGSIRWLLDRKSLIYDHDKKPVQMGGIAKDITARKLAEEKLKLLHLQNTQILHSTGEGIYGLDLEGKATFVNEAAAKMLGYGVEELTGRVMHDNHHFRKSDGSDYPLNDCPIYKTITEGREYRIDDEIFWRKDGTAFPVEYFSSPIFDEGKLIGAVIAFRDITERKLAETTLKETNKQLEMALKYEELFIANMTHEIRTPLNVILGYSSLVKDVMADRIQGAEEEFFMSIESAGKRLMRTVDNVLQFTSLQTGMAKLDHRVDNLTPTVQSIVHELLVHAEEKQIRLSVSHPTEPIRARIDQYTFGQALINLIDNAIKYTNSGEVIVALFKEEDRACVEVRDTGIGISEEYLPKLFQAFTQEDTGYTRSYQGLGLGLSLVKNYVALNGGTVSVQSKKGEGSVFRMEFPLV